VLTSVSKRIIVFTASLASAVPFALCVLIARFAVPSSLPYIVFLQSSTAFGAFIIQAGLRAGLRKEYVEGRKFLVEYTTKSFIAYGTWLAGFLSPIFFFLPFEFHFFPLLAMANASLTLLLGLALLKGEHTASIRTSVTIFHLNLLAGLSTFWLHDYSFSRWVVIEGSALALLCYLQRTLGVRVRKKASLSVVWLICKKYFGLQVASFLIVATAFLLSVLCIKWNDPLPGLLNRYAEVSVACNVLILIGARAILTFEGRFLLNGKAFCLLGAIHLTVLFIAALLAVLYGEKNWYVSFALSSALLGQYAISSTSQYIKESYRFIVLVGCAIPPGFLLLLLYVFPMVLNPAILYLYVNNMTVSAILFASLYLIGGKNAFIGTKKNGGA